MTTDSKLQEDVIAALKWEPRIDAAHIGVTAEAAIVTLSGHVSILEQKQAAVVAARQVKGVEAVADEIEVRVPSNQKCHDDEIGKRAADIIRWSQPTVAERIRISVSHGIITLEGEVEHFFDKVDAEQHVARLSGVTRVDNKLIVKSLINPVDIKEKIGAAFLRSAYVEAQNITVAVDGPNVTLTGQVRSWNEKEQAEQVAWAAPGVTSVENLLEVKI
jgi:osmotically-inducible protein OsmY